MLCQDNSYVNFQCAGSRASNRIQPLERGADTLQTLCPCRSKLAPSAGDRHTSVACEKGKELPCHRLSFRHWPNASQRRLVAIAFYAIKKSINHCGAAWAIGAVLKTAMDH